jgi:hypothetical protein
MLSQAYVAGRSVCQPTIDWRVVGLVVMQSVSCANSAEDLALQLEVLESVAA